tara:strand:+ start:77 stop:235 length:159 start_codon:yes stop_codon:yes gene_type:complete
MNKIPHEALRKKWLTEAEIKLLEDIENYRYFLPIYESEIKMLENIEKRFGGN